MADSDLESHHGFLQLRHPALGLALLRFLPLPEASLSLSVLLLHQARMQLSGVVCVPAELGLRSHSEQSWALQL